MVHARGGKRVEFSHTLTQKVVVVRLVFLMHRCEVFLSTILIKIFEGIHDWHLELNLTTAGRGLPVLRIFWASATSWMF